MTDPRMRGYLIDLTIHGLPGPQGSKTPTGQFRPTKNGGLTPVMRESSKKVKPWRRNVADAGEAAVAQHPHRQRFPLDGPLVGYIVFTLPAPQRKKADEAPAADRTPDVSKLLRSTEDALKGSVWVDDARLIGYDLLWKAYPIGKPGSHRDSLDQPGAFMRIRRATHAELNIDPDSRDGLKYAGLLELWASPDYAAARRTAAQAAAVKEFLGNV